MKISIVTATWNSAETLQDTIDSVLAQNYPDYEHLIIDGGSKDNTVEIIKVNEARYNGKLRWVSEPDKGLYDAFNKGVHLASGDVVGVLNSDDFYASPDVLSQVASGFEGEPELDAVYADVNYVDWNDTKKLVRHYSSGVFKRWNMRLGFMPAHPTFYLKKSTYERFKLDPATPGLKGRTDCAYYNTSYKIAADFEFLLRSIFVGRIKTKYIKQVWVTMRNGGNSSAGLKVHNVINAEHQRAFRENGRYSNLLLESLRYVYKVGELIAWKCKR